MIYFLFLPFAQFICSVFVHSHNSFYAKNYATDLTSLRSFTKIVGNEMRSILEVGSEQLRENKGK